MARKRVDGRFAPEGTQAQGEAGETAAKGMVGAPRPRYCRVFVRKRMAEEMPRLMDVLLEQAKQGSLGHLKMLVQLAGLDKGEVKPKVQRREKSLEAILMEQWDKDQAAWDAKEAARLAEEQDAAEDGGAVAVRLASEAR